jgi:hypothetical protein
MSDNDQIQPSHLKLVKPPSGPSEVLFLERRESDRLITNGNATALITDNTDPKQPNRKICNVMLANISESGLGLIVREPVPTGNHITVFIQPHGPDAGRDLSGTIVRCSKHELGFEIGIKTPNQILAA